MKIEGLDSLMRKIEELEKVTDDLDGNIAHLTFDPSNPESIEQAIQELYASVDEKISGYPGNEIIASIANEIKENGRRAILERAAAARLEGKDEE